jgi:hypothetical protein
MLSRSATAFPAPVILTVALLLAAAAFASSSQPAITDVLVDNAHHTLTINGVNLFGNSSTPPVVTLAGELAPLSIVLNPSPRMSRSRSVWARPCLCQEAISSP